MATQTPLPRHIRRNEPHPHREFDFTMAFQPIVDSTTGDAFAYEALVRGRGGESARSMFAGVDGDQRYAFDQACRIRALCLGHKLGLAAGIAINFLPNALREPEHCLRTTLLTVRHYEFPASRVIFELCEGERVIDIAHVGDVIRFCQAQGFRIAIDDFGAGHSGLNLLADLHPDLIKLDIGLCRGIDGSRTRRAIVHGVQVVCKDLGIGVIAEGIETDAEYAALVDLGVRYFQGYLFAAPGLECLPAIRSQILTRSASEDFLTCASG